MPIETQESALFRVSVSCSRTLTCVGWSPSRWNSTTWATAAYDWCHDNTIERFTVTSESANAKGNTYTKNAACSKMGSKRNSGPISILHCRNIYTPNWALKTSIFSALLNHLPKLRWKKTYMSTESGFYVMPAARTTGCIRGSRENKHWRMSFLNTWCFSQPQIPKFARDTAKPIHSRPTCDFTL